MPSGLNLSCRYCVIRCTTWFDFTSNPISMLEDRVLLKSEFMRWPVTRNRPRLHSVDHLGQICSNQLYIGQGIFVILVRLGVPLKVVFGQTDDGNDGLYPIDSRWTIVWCW